MFPVLDPKGLIAAQEFALMQNVLFLMVIVVVAVFALTFFFAYWYRAGNTRAKYLPNWEHGPLTELVWWAIPIEIVLIIGALTWSSTHALDPHKPIVSTEPSIQVQVVALPSKWLFIYPEEGIAMVNELRIPVGRPVAFSITADAPMNSFWIPALGGQIYAMTGMSTTLNLQADTAGMYRGGSANYSGDGFAHMTFQTHALPEEEFSAWVSEVQRTGVFLTPAVYAELTEENQYPVASFGRVTNDLYNTIVMSFMYNETGALQHGH